jgi:hypothetical protein
MRRSMLVEVVIREATADDYAVLCELFDEVDGLIVQGAIAIELKGMLWE